MNKKRGFTLIELLAAIVIIAMIALIATPLVTNTIERARLNSFRHSAIAIFTMAERYQMTGSHNKLFTEK